MLDVEKYMESFESISKNLEKHKDNFKNLVDRVKNIEITQKDYNKRLQFLEDERNQGESVDIELKQVNFFFLSVPGNRSFLHEVTKINFI